MAANEIALVEPNPQNDNQRLDNEIVEENRLLPLFEMHFINNRAHFWDYAHTVTLPLPRLVQSLTFRPLATPLPAIVEPGFNLTRYTFLPSPAHGVSLNNFLRLLFSGDCPPPDFCRTVAAYCQLYEDNQATVTNGAFKFDRTADNAPSPLTTLVAEIKDIACFLGGATPSYQTLLSTTHLGLQRLFDLRARQVLMVAVDAEPIPGYALNVEKVKQWASIVDWVLFLTREIPGVVRINKIRFAAMVAICSYGMSTRPIPAIGPDSANRLLRVAPVVHGQVTVNADRQFVYSSTDYREQCLASVMVLLRHLGP